MNVSPAFFNVSARGGAAVIAAALLFHFAAAASVAQCPALGWEPGTGAVSSVNALTTWNPGTGPTQVIAGGYFTSEAGSRVSRWDGETWQPLEDGVNGDLFCLTTWDPDGDGPLSEVLVAGGAFTQANGVATRRIASWDGAEWRGLRSGVNGWVHSLTTWDADGPGPGTPVLVAGGRFTIADGVSANRIAYWDGVQWRPFGAGMTGGDSFSSVRAMTSWDPDGDGPLPPRLIAGGSFTHAGGTPVNYIAQWDGVTWSQLNNTSINGFVQALVTIPAAEKGAPPLLVAGGEFTSINGTPRNLIASWDGETWRGFGTGIEGSFVSSLTMWDPDADGPAPTRLVAAGEFYRAGGVPVSHIASWDGAAWSSFGNGINGRITSVIPWDRDGDSAEPPRLVAGGFFGYVDNLRSSGVASYYMGGAQPPVISGSPAPASACPGEVAMFYVQVGGASPLEYQWQVRDPDGWRSLENGVLIVGGEAVADVSGAQTADLVVSRAGYSARFEQIEFRCIVSNLCGSETSEAATLTSAGEECPVDLDCDGATGSEDFFRYLVMFVQNAPQADFNRDGRTNTQDLFDFLTAFFAGC